MAPTLSLRFIRQASKKDATTDDVILIRKEGRRFSLTFRYSNSEREENPQTGTLVAADLRRYVSNILYFLHEDVDPFEYLQVDVPLMPSALFAVNRISSAYDGILNAVQFFIDQDEAEELVEEPYVHAPKVHRKCRSHLFFEEGNEC